MATEDHHTISISMGGDSVLADSFDAYKCYGYCGAVQDIFIDGWGAWCTCEHPLGTSARAAKMLQHVDILLYYICIFCVPESCATRRARMMEILRF